MLVDNITPGALENLIGEGSKSIFITSTEAGGLLNGRLGRSTDLLNSAWDSTPLVKDRVKEERVVVSDDRVCGHFALQGPVLQSIFARTGHLGHGSGLTVEFHGILTRGGCGRKLGLPGGSSCIHTKTGFERSSCTSSSATGSRRPFANWDTQPRMR